MTNKSKVPQIRFKGFIGEWKESELGNKVEFFSGLTYSPNNVVKDNGTLVLRSSNVKDGRIVDADNVYVNSDVINCNNVQKGDIAVVVRNGSRSLIGKHAQIQKGMNNTVIGAFMTGIRSEQPSFINALLDSPKFYKEIEKNLGATINQITTGAFKKMTFSFSEEFEQTKIGDYFQQLDKLIEQKEKKYQKLKQFKKAMLDKMFPKNGADTPEIRFKSFSEKWEEKKLGDLIEFIVDNRGKNPRYYCNEGIPVIDNFMIKNNYHPKLREATRFIDENLFNNFIRKYIEPYDTVITLVGNGIGNITLVPKEKSVIIQNTLGLRFSNDKIFMFYCLLSKNREIKHLDRGMAQPSIRQDELLDIEIKTPKDLEEQEKIGNYFQKLDNQIDLQQKELKKLKNIKKASLSKMFA